MNATKLISRIVFYLMAGIAIKRSWYLANLTSRDKKMTDIKNSEEELQQVPNVLRNWVLDRNGEPFTMNDIYRDPSLSSELSASIETMIVIDKALLALRCTIVNKNNATVSLQNIIYKPPNVRVVSGPIYS